MPVSIGRTVLLLIVAATLSCVYWACGIKPVTQDAGNLEPVQVREYNGEKLSAIQDFRENSIKGSQQIDVKSYRLTIDGLVQNPRNYTYDEVINKYKPYQKLVTLDCVEGWSVKILWQGVLLRDLFNEAGIDPSAKVAIFVAYDNYSTSLPLRYISDNDIILAYKINGITLPASRGFPFQLVAQDKWGYKWIKWVTHINLSSDESYRGYWEKAGYSNDASTDKPYFEK